MAKYKIYTDRPTYSEEEAKKVRNYDFIHRSQKGIHAPLYVLKNIFKKPSLLRKVILILVILLAVFFSFLDEKGSKKTSEDHVDKEKRVKMKE